MADKLSFSQTQISPTRAVAAKFRAIKDSSKRNQRKSQTRSENRSKSRTGTGN
jgi:hypothetical protein